MFRRQKAAKKLSADELKSKLYAHFDKSGSLNQLRSQIRSQLASELFKIAPTSTAVSEHPNKTVDLSNTLLPLQVCNWLVYDHLMRQGYQYTLSTFVSETNLPYPEKLLAVGDILALVGLDNSSSEYKRISDLYSTSNEKEEFHSLLLAIIKSVIFITEKENQQIENVVNSSPEARVKNKLLSSKEKIYQIEPGTVTETLQKNTFRIKELNEAASLESSYYEQLQSMKDEREKEIQNLRRKLVQELERVHSQEQSFYQEIEQERREVRKERDILFNEWEKLKNKEGLFLKEQENKLEKKIREIEELHVVTLHSKEKEISALQDELKEKEKKVGRIEFELSTHRERFETLKRELDDLNKMYKSVHEKYNSLLDENTNLVRKFEKMSDYNILKDELVAKGREISNLQQEIENLHRTAESNKKAYTETVTSLELKLKATESKLRHIQKELNETRDALHMEEALWNKEKQRLEQDSLTSKELYKTVLQRIEEQKQDIHDLHQTIHILHYQVTSGNTNQTIKSELHDPSRTVPKVAFLPSKNNPIFKLNKNIPTSISQQYREKALSFASDYKNRLNKLQREIDEGFDKYSLIRHTSFDTKIPQIKPSLLYNSQTFADNMKFSQPSYTKNSANTSSSFHLDASKSFMMLGNATVPSFINRNNFGQLGETVTSAQNLYDGTKTFIADNPSVTFAKQKSMYADTFPSQIKQAFTTTDIFKSSSSINKMYDRYQESEDSQNSASFSRTDRNRFATDKTIESSSSGIVKTVSTGITENTYKNIPITETVTTGITENIFKDIPITRTFDIERTNNYPNTTGVSVQKSFLLPTASNEISFQNTHKDSIEQSLASTDTNLKDTILPKTSSDLANQATFSNSLKHREAAPITSVPQLPSSQTNQAAPSDSLKRPEAAPIIVDLDAAWKRKTSLPTANPPLLQSSNPLMFSKNPTPDEIKQSNSLSNHPDAMSSKNEQHVALKSFSDISANTKIIENISSSITYEQNTKKISDHQKDSKIMKDKNEDNVLFSQAESIIEVEQKNNKSVVLSDVSGTDEETKEKRSVQSVIKHTPEDSLSELSEVHVSCGSEQEEQKEESDNW